MLRHPLSALLAAPIPVLMAAMAGCTAQAPAPTSAMSDTVPPPVAGDASPWALQISSTGAALVLSGSGGGEILRLTCRRGSADFLVTAPGVKRIGSEERLTLGADDELVTLVVPQVGVAASAPVTGEAPYPEAFLAALPGAGQVAAAYGAQNVGPAPGPGGPLGRRFASACREAVGGR